jgi:hypothetical protein
VINPSETAVFALDETDACLVYTALREHMRRNTWDVNDEEQWNEVVGYKDLVKRLEKYLDGPVTGDTA